MLSPWFNCTIKVQRRATTPSRNSLNEPNYGIEANYPVVYSSLNCRIEYVQEKMQFQPTGERVSETQVFLYVEANTPVLEEDRITVLTSDDTTQIGKLYLIMTVQPEWNSVGNVHHYIAELEIH